MDSTCLTVGGFSQPSVARAIIEQSGSAEIGLAQRFLWLFPQPTYSKFRSLEAIEEGFTDQLGELVTTFMFLRVVISGMGCISGSPCEAVETRQGEKS